MNGVDPFGLYDEEEDLDRRLEMAAQGSAFFATYAYDEDTRTEHDRIMCEGWETLANAGDAALLVLTTLTPTPGDEEAAALLVGEKVLQRLKGLEEVADLSLGVRKGAKTEKQLERLIKKAASIYRQNQKFRRWVHREYKPHEKIPGAGQRNPNLSGEQLLDAYEEWKQLGGP